MSKEAMRVMELFAIARSTNEYEQAMALCGELLDAVEQLAMIDSIIDARLRVRGVVVESRYTGRHLPAGEVF